MSLRSRITSAPAKGLDAAVAAARAGGVSEAAIQKALRARKPAALAQPARAYVAPKAKPLAGLPVVFQPKRPTRTEVALPLTRTLEVLADGLPYTLHYGEARPKLNGQGVTHDARLGSGQPTTLPSGTLGRLLAGKGAKARFDGRWFELAPLA